MMRWEIDIMEVPPLSSFVQTIQWFVDPEAELMDRRPGREQVDWTKERNSLQEFSVTSRTQMSPNSPGSRSHQNTSSDPSLYRTPGRLPSVPSLSVAEVRLQQCLCSLAVLSPSTATTPVPQRHSQSIFISQFLCAATVLPTAAPQRGSSINL